MKKIKGIGHDQVKCDLKKSDLTYLLDPSPLRVLGALASDSVP